MHLGALTLSLLPSALLQMFALFYLSLLMVLKIHVNVHTCFMLQMLCPGMEDINFLWLIKMAMNCAMSVRTRFLQKSGG